MIYLDNAATSPMTAPVIETMVNLMGTHFGNPSSIHTYGRQAKQILRENRETIAALLNVNPSTIIMTSGGTEGNNTILKGYSLAHQSKGKHIITTEIEHHSVLHSLNFLENYFDFEVSYIKADAETILDNIKNALRPDTILVSTMFVNNETGDILPIKKIGELLTNHQAAFHVDAVQAMGKIPITPNELGVDFLTASAHKFHGPKGVGFLYANSNNFFPLLDGGEQENKRRASTENTISIAGMARALQDAYNKQEENYEKIQKLNSQLLKDLAGLDFYINSQSNRLPHVLNIGFPKQDNNILLTRLDLEGIAISTGSACTAGTVTASHVLSSMYGDRSERLKESIRISLSDMNTSEEITTFIKTLKKIIGK